MAKLIERYWDEDIGSKTVDWIVLGAGIVMLGAAVLATTLPGNRALAADDGAVVSIEEV